MVDISSTYKTLEELLETDERKFFNLLTKCDEKYSIGKPIITDLEHDIIKRHAQKLYPTNHYFEEIHEVIFGEKAQLPYILGSLRKYRLDDISKWLNLFKPNEEMIVMEKLDGISHYVRFENGEMIFATTRGDGIEGQIITDKAKYFIPKLKKPVSIELRGELMMIGDDYLKLDFKNRRNGVAGLILTKQIQKTHLKYIIPIYYEILSESNGTEQEKLEYLKSLGLEIPKYEIKNNKDINGELLTKIYVSWTTSTNEGYDIDGLVISPTMYQRENIKKPKRKIAFKVNEDAHRTKILNINWEISRTGRLIPVAQVEPVEISGSVVSNVTVNNATYLQSKGIDEGAHVGIIKANQVIPKIIEIYKSVKARLPKKCPSCTEELTWEGVDLICLNPECPARNIKQVYHFIKTMGLKNVAQQTIDNLNIHTIQELLSLTRDEILSHTGFGEKKVDIILGEIQDKIYPSGGVSPSKFLSALGIKSISDKKASLLLQYFDIDNLFNITLDDLESANIPTLAEISIKKIVNGLHNAKILYDDLIKNHNIIISTKKEKLKKVDGKIFVLTGKADKTRNELVEYIESFGHQVGDRITNETSFLVTDDLDSTSNKMQQATEKGIKIISYKQLDKYLK